MEPLYIAMSIFKTVTYKPIRIVTGKYDYRSTHDDEVFLGASTVCNILVATAFKMPWFNHESDVISPESL